MTGTSRPAAGGDIAAATTSATWAHDPDDRRAAGELVRRLLAEHSPDAVAAELHRLVLGTEPFPTALAAALVELEGPERLRAALAGLPDPPVPDLSEPVRRLLGDLPVRPRAATRLVRLPGATADLSAALWDRTTYLPVEEYAGRGVGAFLTGPIFSLAPAVSAEIDAAAFASEEQRQRARESERLTAYQTQALRHRRLEVADPTTGCPADYLGHYAHHDKVVYRFRGDADFLLVAGGVAGQLRGVYLPADDLFLVLGTQFAMSLDTWPATKIHLARAVVRQRRRPGDAVAPPPSGRARVTARVGGPENFAHLLWNGLGALSREAALGTLGGAARFVVVGSEYFGPVADLFPELGAAEVEARARAGVDGTHVADPSRILLPLGTTVLRSDACRRVAEAADRRAAEPPARDLLAGIAAYRSRVYVALRVGDKSWVDAATELPRLIDHALAEHPDACFLLDGFSVPSGADHVTQRWRPQQEALRALVAGVRARVAEPERVLDLVGLDMLSSLALTRAATCYLAPIGTAHHKVDWLSDVPGVLYVSEEYAALPRDQWAGLRQRLGRHQPVVVIGHDDEESVRRQRANDRRARLSNVTLPWTRLWAALGPLMAQ